MTPEDENNIGLATSAFNEPAEGLFTRAGIKLRENRGFADAVAQAYLMDPLSLANNRIEFTSRDVNYVLVRCKTKDGNLIMMSGADAELLESFSIWLNYEDIDGKQAVTKSMLWYKKTYLATGELAENLVNSSEAAHKIRAFIRRI